MDEIKIQSSGNHGLHTVVCGEIKEVSSITAGETAFNTIFSYDESVAGDPKTCLTTTSLHEVSCPEQTQFDVNPARFRINTSDYSVFAHNFCEANFVPSLTFNSSTNVMGISNVSELKRRLYLDGVISSESLSNKNILYELSMGTANSLFDVGIIYRGRTRKKYAIKDRHGSYKTMWFGIGGGTDGVGFYRFGMNFDTGEITNSQYALSLTRQKYYPGVLDQPCYYSFFGLIFRWRKDPSSPWVKSRRSFNSIRKDTSKAPTVTNYLWTHRWRIYT